MKGADEVTEICPDADGRRTGEVEPIRSWGQDYLHGRALLTS